MVTLPVTVAEADAQEPGETPQEGSSADTGTIFGAIAGVLALLGVLSIVFAGPIDQVLGPIARLS